jgi:hypothetical protein
VRSLPQNRTVWDWDWLFAERLLNIMVASSLRRRTANAGRLAAKLLGSAQQWIMRWQFLQSCIDLNYFVLGLACADKALAVHNKTTA